jgi:hypothetical protein
VDERSRVTSGTGRDRASAPSFIQLPATFCDDENVEHPEKSISDAAKISEAEPMVRRDILRFSVQMRMAVFPEAAEAKNVAEAKKFLFLIADAVDT